MLVGPLVFTLEFIPLSVSSGRQSAYISIQSLPFCILSPSVAIFNVFIQYFQSSFLVNHIIQIIFWGAICIALVSAFMSNIHHVFDFPQHTVIKMKPKIEENTEQMK